MTLLETHIHRHREALERLHLLAPALERVTHLCTGVLDAGGKILVCGNGGSAADAQHLAAELTGRYRLERRPLAAVALTTDSSALTCIGNDYAFAEVFSRQVLALARPGDVVLGLSTSGESENVWRALEAARACGAVPIALTGEAGGRVAEVAEVALKVPSHLTAHVQELHILLIHALCEAIDLHVVGSAVGRPAS